MIGAILGDYIGSRFEKFPIKTTEFELFHPACRFTDDTVLSIATLHAIQRKISYKEAYLLFGRRNPSAGYSKRFELWLSSSNPQPYGSYGNGSAMRVSPIGWAFDTYDKVIAEARESAIVTHSHQDGIVCAQAVAASVFLARIGTSKDGIKKRIEDDFGINLSTPLDEVRPNYKFDMTAMGSVPLSIRCFLESDSWESAIRLAISMGGDADTMACIAGGIAEAYYKNK